MSDTHSTEFAPSRLPPGTRLNGIFEIDHHVASGGMGEIYRGHTVETGDPVAIKVMRTDLADNAALGLALFRKEASALHNLHHDAIVRYYVFSLDPDTRRHYLAMEFVDGQPLSELLKDGPLAFETVRHLQERLAAGLEAAHRYGIIHRDLSPDNILIPGGDVGRAKIIDFGIARSTRVGDGTIIGSGFAGKFNYVSPEQLGLFNGDVTAKSDIYSLGLVLAECLVGQPIDMGGSQFEVLEKRRTVPNLDAIDARFRPLIFQMLQSDPQDRPDSMAAVAAWRPEGEASANSPATAHLQSAPHRTTGTLGPARPAIPRWLVFGAFAALLLFGLGGAGLYFITGSSKPTSDGSASAPPFLNPDSSVDARRAEDRRRTTAEAAAKQQAADEAKRISEAAAKAAAVAPPTDRPATDPKERITRFVNAYDGGDCFFVTPVSVADGSATLEGYGGSATPFEVLDYEFKRANGFEATVGYYNVTSPQCPAISFLSRLRSQRGPAPRLDVSAGSLRSNGFVTGFISDFGNRHVELLMVDHEGIVQSLTKLLKGSGDTRTFTINIRRGDAGAPKLQLLFALASTKPIETLKAGQAGSGEIGASDQVFPKVLDETLLAGQALNVTAKSFNLEK